MCKWCSMEADGCYCVAVTTAVTSRARGHERLQWKTAHQALVHAEQLGWRNGGTVWASAPDAFQVAQVVQGPYHSFALQRSPRHRDAVCRRTAATLTTRLLTYARLPMAATMSSLRLRVSLQVPGTRGRRPAQVMSWSLPAC
jgi:hypothetical protein